jgi:WS/DGAT/MGAT family acyltransferase
MEQLSGLDAAFLAMESATVHMHVGAVMVFEDPDVLDAGVPSGDFPSGLAFASFRQHVEDRLHLVPPLRRRVMRIPLGLHHPVWVEDPGFELDFHLRRARLPGGGGPKELAAYIGAITGRPFDDSRPLWEMHLIEGLEEGHVAIAAKVHHSLVDGISGTDLIAAFLDLDAQGRDIIPPSEPWNPPAVPTERDLLLRGIGSLVHQPEVAATALRHTVDSLLDLSERNRKLADADFTERPPSMFQAPRTSLNGPISRHRRYAFCTYSLEEIRAVRQAFGGTVNDVVLATVAGAARQLFAERREEVSEPLVAMVPMSTRSKGERGELGNKLSAMLVSLATTTADPLERYRAIVENSRLAKAQARVVTGELIARWAEVMAPAFSSRVMRLATNLRLFDHLPPLFNISVSNVPGPNFPLWCAGQRMTAMYPMGPIMEGVGVNVTVMRYLDRLCVGVTACRDLVPDVDSFANHLGNSLTELLKSARREGAS